jgi:hypothetical protein
MKTKEHTISMKSNRVLSVVDASRQMRYRYEVLFATSAGFGVVHNPGFHEYSQTYVY